MEKTRKPLTNPTISGCKRKFDWNQMPAGCSQAALIFVLLCSQILFAQTDIEHAIRADNVTQPEIYQFKFNSAGSVDYHGDYSAQIPLMTVPGRGGLDQPITLTYKSGITTDQRATWVGLGWNLNPGTITRVINGIPDNITGHGTGYCTGNTESGAIEHYFPYSTSGCSFPEHDPYDLYLVNIPGVVSGLLIPTYKNYSPHDSVPDYVFQEWNGWQVSMWHTYSSTSGLFSRVNSSNKGSTVRTYDDIFQIVLVNDRGVKYVFGLPLRSEMILNHPDSGLPRFIVEYVASWQLTSISTPDCWISSGELIPGTNVRPLAPDENGPGNWIKFEYNYPNNSNTNATLRNIRPLHYYRDPTNRSRDMFENMGDQFGLLTQTTYLSKIKTPTHEAVFITSNTLSSSSRRYDISYLSPYNIPNKPGIIGDFTTDTLGQFICPLRLDHIILNQRFPTAESISFVKFDYASLGQELCRYSTTGGIDNLNFSGMGKTTLKGLSIGDSTESFFYRFKYTDSVDGFNPPHIGGAASSCTYLGPLQAVPATNSEDEVISSYHRTRSGRMGYLYASSNSASPCGNEVASYGTVISNSRGMAAWSLRTIEYSTGIVDTIAYESDVMDKSLSAAGSDLVPAMWENFAEDEAGIRVRYIASFDPQDGKTRRTYYQYPRPGILPGLPNSYMRNSSSKTGTQQRRKFQFGYSSDEVEYPEIVTINPDSSRVRTIYTSALDGIGYFNHQISTGTFTLAEDASWYRGKVTKVEQFDVNKQIVTQSASNYEDKVIFPGISRIIGYIGQIPIYEYSQYVNSKKLSIGHWLQKKCDSTAYYDKNSPSSSEQSVFTKHTTYTYHSYFPLLTGTDEWVDNSGISKSIWYAFENSVMLLSRNILRPLSQQQVYQNTKQTTDTKNLGDSITAFPMVLISRLQTSTKYSVTDDGYIRTVYSWTDLNFNGDISDDEYIPIKTVTAFDKYGNPLSIKDAGGLQANLEWDSLYAGAKLTKRSVTSGGMEFKKLFTYNKLHLLSSETDDNGTVTTYSYDGLGRLKRVIGPGNATLKTYQYHFKNSQQGVAFPLGGIPNGN